MASKSVGSRKAADMAFDKRMGVKEGSAKDKKIDRMIGVKDKGKPRGK